MMGGRTAPLWNILDGVICPSHGWPRLLKRCASVWICLVLISCGDPPSDRKQIGHGLLADPAAAPLPFQAAGQKVQDAVESGLVSGAVLLISRNGAVETLRAFGHAIKYGFEGMPVATPEPMTSAHLFDLASLTKVFATTFGIMILVDRGQVDIDTPVRKYLPEFRGASKDSITVRHLLTHTAGLSPWQPTYFHADSPHEVFDYIRTLPQEYAVGKKRHYSDLGFMLLGYLIERVSGKGLDEFVGAEVYAPLGLSQTGFAPHRKDLFQHRAFAATSRGNPFERKMVEDPDFGYRVHVNPDAFAAWREYMLIGEVNDGNSYYAHRGVAGHAGLFSSAADLDVLMTLLLHGGTSAGKQLLSEEVVRGFLSPDRNGQGLGWAMSASILPVDSMPAGAFGHTGFTGTYAFADPGTGLSIILLTNRQHGGVDSSGAYPSLSDLRRAVTRAVLESAE